MKIYFLIIFLSLYAISVYAEDLTNVIYLWCTDGDTCSFDILPPAVLNSNIRVRFAGLDAPEINGHCAKEKQLALEARDFVRAQLKEAEVVLQHVSRDKYYRIDATIIANGVNLNELLIKRGYAVPYSGSGIRHNWCEP